MVSDDGPKLSEHRVYSDSVGPSIKGVSAPRNGQQSLPPAGQTLNKDKIVDAAVTFVGDELFSERSQKRLCNAHAQIESILCSYGGPLSLNS